MLTEQIVVTSASKITSSFCRKNGAAVISYLLISPEGHFMMYYSRSNVLVTWSQMLPIVLKTFSQHRLLLKQFWRPPHLVLQQKPSLVTRFQTLNKLKYLLSHFVSDLPVKWENSRVFVNYDWHLNCLHPVVTGIAAKFQPLSLFL